MSSFAPAFFFSVRIFSVQIFSFWTFFLSQKRLCRLAVQCEQQTDKAFSYAVRIRNRIRILQIRIPITISFFAVR